MIPTPDAFRALARSSPWRWSTLHFVHRAGGREECEAWVRRPGELLVRDAGRLHRIAGVPYGRMLVSTDPDLVQVTPVPPQAVEPGYRPDGLVAQRPDSWEIEYDDPMWVNYSWVAMLDPVELSDHVSVEDLRATTVVGRPVWRAFVRALPGYAPRCGGNCCELLWSEVGRVCEVEDPADAYVGPGADYPDGYDVALDVQTGVVVRCLPVGGDPAAPWLEVDIREVDVPLEAVLG